MSARIVFNKEIREMLRDRRVTVGAFVMPILMIVLMLQMFGLIERGVTQGRASKIAVVRGGEKSAIAEGLKKLPGSEILVASDVAAGKEMLANGKARLLLDFGVDFNQQFEGGKAKFSAYYNSSEPLSAIALRTVQVAVDGVNKESAKQALRSNDLPEAILDPIEVAPVDTAKPQAAGSEMLLSLLPYMIVLWAFYGGFSTVSDMMAGEKERGTLETLLLSPVSRKDIATGKLLALGLICLLSSLSAVVGVMLSTLMGKQSTMLFRLDLTGIFAILAMVLPLVAMFSGILFAVSTWARNMREAQTYLTSVSFVVLIPALFSNLIGFTGVDKAIWLKFVPILSTGVGLRGAFLGTPDWTLILASGAIHLALGAICWVLIYRMMMRDRVLARI